MAKSEIEGVLRANLTADQYEAAIDEGSEILTLACAGSGKSRTLAFRIARLLAADERPSGIVAFTFTEKAAESIKLQVGKALLAAGLEPTLLGAMYIGTIHSYCQYILGEMDARYRQFEVLDENRLKLYLISRYPGLLLHRIRDARAMRHPRQRRPRYFETIKEIATAWLTINDELLDVVDVYQHDPELGEALRRIQELLDRDEFIDFSLMVRLAVEALRRHDAGARRAVAHLSHLMVDEYQDVNPSQEALIQELHQYSSTLFVVGDDDQSIYSWRGADVSRILTFTDRYPTCSRHTLSQNFRSTPTIVEAADAFIAAELGPTRITKDPFANQSPGSQDARILWFDTRAEEADWVVQRIGELLGTRYQERDTGAVRGLTPADFAILMRSTRSAEQNGDPRHAAFTQRLVGALGGQGIRYTLEAGGGVFDRPQVAVLRSTFELLRSGAPTREVARDHFDQEVLPAYPAADFGRFAAVLAEWARLIHGPTVGARRRVYPQQLVHDLLAAFNLPEQQPDDAALYEIGLFSRMIQDVESVYLSIDSARRFREILNFLQNPAESGYDTSTQEILRRPDAVTVSTVHKMKGLEFPVVFVVDVERGRFPGSREQYQGWLPVQVLGPALDRGAYQNTRAEEARLFYTAVTRAERYLHVTGAAHLPAGRRLRRPSDFALRLARPGISDDPHSLPDGLTAHPPARRVDETILPTSYSDIRYYLRCPKDYQFRKAFGFSPPITEMFGYGRSVHASIGKLHERFPDSEPTPEEAGRIAEGLFHLKHAPRSADPENRPGPYERARDSAGQIARDYAGTYAADFTRRRQIEVRFEIPLQHAVVTGSIDLMLREDENGEILEASVVDFKAIEGGSEPEEESERLRWTELSLQVQLYAKAAREVLGERARTGAVHLLKDNVRVDVPVDEDALDAAVANVEWAVDRIIAGDFPMRPHPGKCEPCDFRALCPKAPQQFGTDILPPPIRVPGQETARMARAFDEFEGNS